MKFLILYLLLINAIGFLIMLTDKQKAQKNIWRIPERTIFTLAILGGSIGIICGIYLFRHKTKHKRFTVGIPIISTLQILILFAIFYIKK